MKTKTRKKAYIPAYILLIICISSAYYFESTYILNGDIRFITIMLFYSLGILLGILSPLLFVINCISENRKSYIWLSVFTLIPIYWLVTHSGIYYKDVFGKKIEFHSDVFLIDNFEGLNKKTLTIECNNKVYDFRLTDAQYDELKNDPVDKSRPAVDFELAKIYHAKYPIKISFYENTGIISNLQILTP